MRGFSRGGPQEKYGARGVPEARTDSWGCDRVLPEPIRHPGALFQRRRHEIRWQ